MKSAISNLVQVEIESLAIGGDGVGRLSKEDGGLVVFVPESAPQDLLEIRITETHKNFCRGEIVQILKASPHRKEAPCSYFPRCGGCSWQHISEAEQLRQKEQLIVSSLKKFLKLESIPFRGMIASPKSFRYRNRIQPHYRGTDIGFFKKRSHELVAIDDCLITEESVTARWPEIQEKLSQVRRKEGQIEISLADKGSPLMSPPADQLQASTPPPETSAERGLETQWRFIDKADESVGFSQVNRFLNKALVEKAVEISKSQEFSGRVLDLYAGSGNFTFPLSNAHKKKQVLGVEMSPVLADRFRKRSLQEKIPPKFLEVYNSDVEIFLQRFEVTKDDFILLDPPRIGTSPLVMRTLAQSRPAGIVYISCHPTTLARDLAIFFEEAGKQGFSYRIEQVLGFDLFPQTDHVETLVELRIDSF